MSGKTFNRNVCFMFFESYLSQAELIKEQYGEATAYRCLSGIAKYALYQEEPEDIMAKIVVEGLKNAIDAGQTKRSKGFKEDIEMTNMILQYKAENPGASYQNIADALGCSKGKISKVLSKANADQGMTNDSSKKNVRSDKSYEESHIGSRIDSSAESCDDNYVHDGVHVTDNSNINSNLNLNLNLNNTSNSNSNLNSNSVTVNTVNTVNGTPDLGEYRNEEKESSEETDAFRSTVNSVNEESFTFTDSVNAIDRKNRELYELDDSELDVLMKKYKSRTKYSELYKEFGLANGCLDKNLVENIKKIKNERQSEGEERKVSRALGLDISECRKLADKFNTLPTMDGVVACVNILKERLDNPDECDIKDLVYILNKYEYGLGGCHGDWDWAAKDWEHVSSGEYI